MRPLRYQGRLPCSGLRLLDIFVKPTLACYRLVGIVERPLGPRRRVCQIQGGGMGAPVPGALGVALCRARRAQVAAVVPCRARGGAAGGAPPGLARAGVETPETESGRGWSVFFSARTSESTRLVGGNGWRYVAPSSVSSPEPASGGSPRLESRDLERALSVSWASRLGCVENLSLPRVARFLTGRHVACCLYGGQRKEGVWGKVAGWERRVKKVWRQIFCCGVTAVSSDISVFQQTARYGPRLRPASVMVAATPTGRIKGVQQ